MAKKDSLPSRVRISDLEGEGDSLEFDCLLVPHPETGLQYATIELYGREGQHHDLNIRSGNMVRFEHLIEPTDRQPREPDGLGRVLGGTWTWGTSVGSSEIQKIGTIRVLRYDTYLSFGADADKRDRCSHVFHRQVDGWFETGMYGLSYDGSIELRRFRNGANLLMNSRRVRGEAYKNYFYLDEEHKVIRFGLPAVEFVWKPEIEIDHNRHYRCATLLLKFIFGVELRPISRFLSIGGEVVWTVWPSEIDREPTRHRMEGPILFSEVPGFLREGLKALINAEYDIEALDDAVDRYVHATTQLTIEQSFVGGCEAIEAIYKLVEPTRQGLEPRIGDLFSAIKSVARHMVSGRTERSAINGRIKSALLPGLWPQIYSFVKASRSGLDFECSALVERCQFHRLRNQFVHGARATSGHEMFVQRDLMEYVFVSLLLHVLGDRKRRPPVSETLRAEINGGSGRPIRLIQIYD